MVSVEHCPSLLSSPDQLAITVYIFYESVEVVLVLACGVSWFKAKVNI